EREADDGGEASRRAYATEGDEPSVQVRIQRSVEPERPVEGDEQPRCVREWNCAEGWDHANCRQCQRRGAREQRAFRQGRRQPVAPHPAVLVRAQVIRRLGAVVLDLFDGTLTLRGLRGDERSSEW